MDNKNKLATELSTPQQKVIKLPVQATARELKSDLGGSYEDRMKAERTVYVKINGSGKPEVIFTGFWNGKFVHVAMNSISRSFRLLRHKNIRSNPQVMNPQ